jgi:hypothetical protein
MSEFELTEELILSISPILKRLAEADRETRAKLQNTYGVDVIAVNYYSNTPSIDEIENSYEYQSDDPPYLNTDVFEHETLQQMLRQLLKFSAEFTPPVDGDENNPNSFFWGNSMFSYSDAISYYSFVRLIRPASIVEIGSGFSTLVAIEAVEKNQFGTIHCIEPYPRQFLKQEKRINIHPLKAQDISSEYLNEILRDNDILFIDSTHTVKAGSDCLHIYLRLLPKIKRDIFIHVHDVFLPFAMPEQWQLDYQYYWTEQYLLLAFLIDNPKAKVLYGSTYNVMWNWPLMEKLMEKKSRVGGGSLWFRYNGSLPYKGTA